MQVTIRTTVGIWLVTASANISRNPDRFEYGEDEYIFSGFEARTLRGVDVLDLLTEGQKAGVMDALFEEYHEAKAEAAEARQLDYA